jgi:hypothetical protein
MNIIDAVQNALDSGAAIMNFDRGEWIILSGGALRYKCNREVANLGPKDILSMNWITENDLITISRSQIEFALKKLTVCVVNDNYEINGIDAFFDIIMQANYNNLKLRGENVRT